MDTAVEMGPNQSLAFNYGDSILVVTTPATKEPTGIAVIEQGGGWQFDSSIPPQVRGFFWKLGVVYVETFYPVHSVELAVKATVDAVLFVKKNAPVWNNADPSRIFLSGASAGGFNAVRAAMVEPVWRVGGYSAACLSLEGAPVPPVPTAQVLAQFCDPNPANWPAHTPLGHLDDPGVPTPLVGPLFHAEGDSQIPLSWIENWVAAANARGHDISLFVQPGGEHMTVVPEVGTFPTTNAVLAQMFQNA